jgi:2-keto-4-pentenoate hydratase/2-oxohepta-3-ene-1,7-dioic acid hydratase in catechol pathway
MDKIICVGKNYLEHTKELGEAQPDLPVLFLKPPSVLKQASNWGDLLLVSFPQDAEVVPECELVLEIGKDGYCISEQQASTFISRVTVGLDVTLRSRQRELKKNGHPWTTAKVFPDAAIIGPWQDIKMLPNWNILDFSLHYNGTILQCASAKEMLYSPAFLVHYISHFFPLCKGDVVFMGTPAGCKSINFNQKVSVFLGDKNFMVKWKLSQ